MVILLFVGVAIVIDVMVIVIVAMVIARVIIVKFMDIAMVTVMFIRRTALDCHEARCREALGQELRTKLSASSTMTMITTVTITTMAIIMTITD